MDNSILELLSHFMGAQNQRPQTHTPQQNPSAASYPPEAVMQSTNQQQNQFIQNNQMLNILSQLMGTDGGYTFAMLSSLLGKDNPLAGIMGLTNKKEENRTSSPKDEILL